MCAFADRLGFDPIAQVESGFVSMNGYPDRKGVCALSPVMDISTAMMACNAVLGALVARERSGVGQSIEVSLFDNAVLMTGYDHAAASRTPIVDPVAAAAVGQHTNAVLLASAGLANVRERAGD